MASVTLNIYDDEGNEVTFSDSDQQSMHSSDGVDELLSKVYAKARKIYPEKEGND